MELLSRIPSTILYTIDNSRVLAASAVFAAIFLKGKIEKHQAIGYVLSLIRIGISGL